MDERIFWKFGLSLSGNGYKVQITTSVEELHIVKENITINSFDGLNITKREKINRFFNIINEFDADLIICCEPLPILAAHKFRKIKRSCKIIYDITEWYPYRSHYKLYKGFRRISIYIRQYLFNIYATNLADHLIIGEELKANRYRIWAPFIKKTIIGYYPPQKYFKFNHSIPRTDKICFCYCGHFTEERGFKRVISVLSEFADIFTDRKINLLLIGSFINDGVEKWFREMMIPENLKIKFKGYTNYDTYSELLSDADVCIDLRTNRGMLDNSLPIKIFDYMAAGKPVIYSRLSSLKTIEEIETFGFLIDPYNVNEILKVMSEYLNNTELRIDHSDNARKLFEQKYNWEILSEKLLKIIGVFLNK